MKKLKLLTVSLVAIASVTGGAAWGANDESNLPNPSGVASGSWVNNYFVDFTDNDWQKKKDTSTLEKGKKLQILTGVKNIEQSSDDPEMFQKYGKHIQPQYREANFILDKNGDITADANIEAGIATSVTDTDNNGYKEVNVVYDDERGLDVDDDNKLYTEIAKSHSAPRTKAEATKAMANTNNALYVDGDNGLHVMYDGKTIFYGENGLETAPTMPAFPTVSTECASGYVLENGHCVLLLTADQEQFPTDADHYRDKAIVAPKLLSVTAAQRYIQGPVRLTNASGDTTTFDSLDRATGLKEILANSETANATLSTILENAR
ncbi:MAG: hypothetical protein IJ560_02455 [Alphaproteobacteria bacterium]|nr:hypothetical protein [Alphaproteobacteria bacterium]